MGVFSNLNCTDSFLTPLTILATVTLPALYIGPVTVWRWYRHDGDLTAV